MAMFKRNKKKIVSGAMVLFSLFFCIALMRQTMIEASSWSRTGAEIITVSV